MDLPISLTQHIRGDMTAPVLLHLHQDRAQCVRSVTEADKGVHNLAKYFSPAGFAANKNVAAVR